MPINLEEQLEPKSHIRTIVATIITIGVLLFIGFFAWRVYYYGEQIKAGGPNLQNLSFGEITQSNALSNAPIPQGEFTNLATDDDPSLGSPGAPIEIVEFADFGCPFSRTVSFSLRALAREYGDQIHYVYRDFPLRDLHPQAQLAAEAGECAHDQNRFWEMHDKMYLNQTDLSEERIERMAQEIGLNVRDFRSCLKSQKYTDEVYKDEAAGVSAGVRGTPTFFINGNRIPGAIPENVLRQIFDQILISNAQ